jgi:hypothetical protein
MAKRKKKPPLNVIGAAAAGLGVPGLILTVAISVAVAGGLSGAAAITAALAAIGLGGGMIGGVAVLVVAGLLATGITIYGSEAVIKAVIKELKKRGRKKDELLRQVESYWVSRGLKLKVKEYVEELWV